MEKNWALIKDKVVVNIVNGPCDAKSEGVDLVIELPDGEGTERMGTRYYAPISATALRLTLLGAGIFPSLVDAKINAIPDQIQREAAKIMWEYATEYHRDHPLISQLGGDFGLSEDQINALWAKAEELT